MSQLSPCPACQRHARLTDAACPFCNAPLAATRGTARPSTVLSRGAKRAALFALGASVTVTACGGEADEGDSTDDNAVPIYGAPVSPTDSASPEPSNTVNPKPSSTTPDVDPPNQPVYGAPVTPPEDLDDTDSDDSDDTDSTDDNTDDSSAESAIDGGAPALPDVDGGVLAVDGGTGRHDGGGTLVDGGPANDADVPPVRTDGGLISPGPEPTIMPLYGAPPVDLDDK